MKSPDRHHSQIPGCCMKVLVACEFSGTVRDAFTAMGHYALSCDLLPSDTPGEHYQGDVRDILNDGWDLMIAHPPCTYLCNGGNNWLNRRPDLKWRENREIACSFFLELVNAMTQRERMMFEALVSMAAQLRGVV